MSSPRWACFQTSFYNRRVPTGGGRRREDGRGPAATLTSAASPRTPDREPPNFQAARLHIPAAFARATNRPARAHSPFSSGPGAWLVAGAILVLSWKENENIRYSWKRRGAIPVDSLPPLSNPLRGGGGHFLSLLKKWVLRSEGGRKVIEVYSPRIRTRESVQDRHRPGPRGVHVQRADTRSYAKCRRERTAGALVGKQLARSGQEKALCRLAFEPRAEDRAVRAAGVPMRAFTGPWRTGHTRLACLGGSNTPARVERGRRGDMELRSESTGLGQATRVFGFSGQVRWEACGDRTLCEGVCCRNPHLQRAAADAKGGGSDSPSCSSRPGLDPDSQGSSMLSVLSPLGRKSQP